MRNTFAFVPLPGFCMVKDQLRRHLAAMTVASAVLPSTLVAQSQPSATAARVTGRALAIEDYYAVKTVASPSISPDGRWVTFTVMTKFEATNTETGAMWVVPSNGSADARTVGPSGTMVGRGQWSADSRLCFPVGAKFFSVDPSTPDTISETTSPCSSVPRGGPDGSAAIASVTSSDGKRMAILRDTPPPKPEPRAMSDFERRHEERFKGAQFDWLDFQRDGQPFPVPNRVDPNVTPPMEIVISENGSERQLTRLGLRPAGMSFSPDGRRLVFTADSGYRDERKYGASQIYTVTLDGAVRRVTTDKDYNYTSARFSPDGRWILSTRQLSTNAVIRRKLNHGGATDLVLIPADAGPEKILTPDWDYLPAGAVWSSDSRYVYFTGGVGGSTHLFRVSPNG